MTTTSENTSVLTKVKDVLVDTPTEKVKGIVTKRLAFRKAKQALKEEMTNEGLVILARERAEKARIRAEQEAAAAKEREQREQLKAAEELLRVTQEAEEARKRLEQLVTPATPNESVATV